MAKQILVRADEKRMLEEILVRIRALQNALDENEIEVILRNPQYLKGFHDAEADIRAHRERPLASLLRDLRKRT